MADEAPLQPGIFEGDERSRPRGKPIMNAGTGL
jgi:two-component system cell cycle sensor histidine kinase PleC